MAEQSATKRLEEATRDLNREYKKRNVEVEELKRKNVRLVASNKVLDKKNAAKQVKVTELDTLIDAKEQQLEKLAISAEESEKFYKQLEQKRLAKASELADLQTAVQMRKETIDAELNAYSLDRKTAIKDEILSINQELTTVKGELKEVTVQAEAKRQELVTLNQAAIQEQEDLKVSKSTIDSELVDKQAELDEFQRKIEDTKSSLQKLFYERDNAMLTIAKTKEEHDKFVKYEEKARKILNAKDRELTERSSDIDHESQLLKNRRSFLSEM